MVFILIVGVILWFVIAYLIAVEFRTIAEMKGHDGHKYFLWTFWLGLVGMLMVIALPDQAKREQGNEVSNRGIQSAAPNNAFDNEELPDL